MVNKLMHAAVAEAIKLALDCITSSPLAYNATAIAIR